ncbi:AbiH family protein [Listeria cornellensis]|uniref:Bacteriophage abortive infection AbiH n=1 Tax=Listeria cornellensis FSL F6-0969 TaxID=1265820 RepID=W7BID2_9LIST|nr:AbiH family protein [Listeria cornellensis]EUJ25682.1 hypothetical protein PCORN_16305 [Listeria cornellensis FSL F6-0969]
MEITFLVGNGFDKMHGLNTSYSQFYSWINNSGLGKSNFLYNQIKTDTEKWSDFELQMGQATYEIVEGSLTSEEFLLCLEEFSGDFKGYIEKEIGKFEIPSIERTLSDFHSELDEKAQNKIKQILQPKGYSMGHGGGKIATTPITYNFINFNYTDTLAKSLEKIDWDCVGKDISNAVTGNQGIKINAEMGKHIHIHETLAGGMFLGVNDVSQLDETKFNEVQLDILIKPRSIEEYDDERITEIEKIIMDSSIIIVFGMSFGATDKKWWESIIRKAEETTTYVILHYYDAEGKFELNRGNHNRYLQNKRVVQDELLCHKSDISKENRRKFSPIVNSKILFTNSK